MSKLTPMDIWNLIDPKKDLMGLDLPTIRQRCQTKYPEMTPADMDVVWLVDQMMKAGTLQLYKNAIPNFVRGRKP